MRPEHISLVKQFSNQCSPKTSNGSRFRRFHRQSAPVLNRASYGSFATFSDPDENGYLMQEVTMRLAGRVWP